MITLRCNCLQLVDVTQNRNLLKRLVNKKLLAAPGAPRKEGLYNITELGVEHGRRLTALARDTALDLKSRIQV